MKKRMEELKQTKIDLAEFFCEDASAFKLEECYKSLASFCSKFKQAVTENVKRREQEDLAEKISIIWFYAIASAVTNTLDTKGTFYI